MPYDPTGLPRLIEPRLPTPAEKPPSGSGSLHEIKYDGSTQRYVPLARCKRLRTLSTVMGCQRLPVGVRTFRLLSSSAALRTPR